MLCLRDVSALKSLTKAEDDKKMTNLLTASVSHELLIPLKCIGSFSSEIANQVKHKNLKYKAELVSSTSQLVLSQVKFLLDKTLLDQKIFTP